MATMRVRRMHTHSRHIHQRTDDVVAAVLFFEDHIDGEGGAEDQHFGWGVAGEFGVGLHQESVGAGEEVFHDVESASPLFGDVAYLGAVGRGERIIEEPASAAANRGPHVAMMVVDIELADNCQKPAEEMADGVAFAIADVYARFEKKAAAVQGEDHLAVHIGNGDRGGHPVLGDDQPQPGDGGVGRFDSVANHLTGNGVEDVVSIDGADEADLFLQHEAVVIEEHWSVLLSVET